MNKKTSIEFKQDVMELYRKGLSAREIADELFSTYYDYNFDGFTPDFRRSIKNFRSRVSMCILRNKDKANTPKEKRLMIQNLIPSQHNRVWDGTTEIKIAVIGDTHFGSKYTQFQHLNNFYDICEAEGITDVYHVGDLTDGLKMRPGHEYDLYATAADEMVDDVVEKYPKRKGVVTYFITGNHDASIYKHVGYDIGRAIEQRRDDMFYLGRDCAVINLTDNCTLELRHPWDATAYALSYKPQKMIEAMESDSKPNILAIGHYHKAEYLFYRNVHAIQTGCFQGQTPFTRGKGISVNLGGWLITIKVTKDGTIKSIAPQFIPYYKSISNDYKNR